MKLLFDFFPVIFFFIVFKFYGIYAATAIAIIASFLQISLYWLKHRRFEISQTITLVLIVILGGATLLSHNTLFIKWKPTAVYWVLAIVFVTSQFGEKTIIQRLMDSKINLPKNIWKQLNISWCVFFVLLGIVNLYVAYHYSTAAWVNFKLFGALGSTLVFVLIQALYMTKFVENEN
ncbi:MAG: septation protein A [Gammaproteobacteria bacterium]|nr:septation protein A [Gammaproteobacteria bacterium]